jgi:myo-inositol-1-phosphate synthase
MSIEQLPAAPRRLGLAIVGLGGAVATTVVAGLDLLSRGLIRPDGLPLAGAGHGRRAGARGHPDPLEVDHPHPPEGDRAAAHGAEGGGPATARGLEHLAGYDSIVVGGWDLAGDDLATAASQHGVLDPNQLAAAWPALAALRPWPAAGDPAFCRNVTGANAVEAGGHRSATELIRTDLRRFAQARRLEATVMVNLASTERPVDRGSPALATIDAFEHGLDADDPSIGPAMLYAYAAIRERVPYVNFTPSVAADVPALIKLAETERVPIAGKDGKTGQTLIKTVLAPALRDRALHVDGWFSANLLGNRDGLALDDPSSLASKLGTKTSALDELLGYPVPDHIVEITYYRPRGDAKEAWDSIDLTGFLGQRMQVKINLLCRDSILAAPLVIELTRLAELAARRGEAGVQEQFGAFFKAPMTPGDGPTEHAFHLQQARLMEWLAGAE